MPSIDAEARGVWVCHGPLHCHRWILGVLHSGVDITRGTDGYLRRIGLQKAQVQVEKIGDYVRDVVTMGGSEGKSAKGVQLSRTGCVQDASYS